MGYETAYRFARFGWGLGGSLGIGAVSQAAGIVGGIALGLDLGGNVVNTGQGLNDMLANGINWQNSLQVAGGTLGLTANGIAVQSKLAHSFNKTPTDLRVSQGAASAERGFIDSNDLLINRFALSTPACFAAETPLLTPGGHKRIEEFEAGDWVLCAPEDIEDGDVTARQVEEVFQTVSPVIELHVNGKVIRTTVEHPFYVLGKGWQDAGALESGDCLRGRNGRPYVVDRIVASGEVETVYNVRVQEHHTYFVGSLDWDFAVWSHNAPCGPDELVRWKWKGHQSGAEAQDQLRRIVQGLPDELVVRWNADVAENGADIISVNLRTGAVTL